MSHVKFTAFCMLLLCLLLACQAQGDLSAPEKSRLMFALLSDQPEEAEDALVQIIMSQDEAFVPLLIDLLWISGSDLAPLPNEDALVDALEQLTDQSFAADWAAWAAWYGQTEILPPPGIAAWKGQFFSRIDTQFAQFFDGETAVSFRPEEIVWGGVGVDGIPSLDYLAQIPAAEAKGYSPHDAVFGLSINGEQRAYPLRVVDWHEMVNDVVGGVPITIAYCTLCGAAIAYAGEVESGVVYDFGSSGLLYRSNKLMYDRQTGSLWNQLNGQPVIGEAVSRGESLRLLPIVLTSWGDWQLQHPNTSILPLETGFVRDYSSGAAYGDYFVTDETRFPVGLEDGRLPAKEQVFALRLNEQAKAYPLSHLLQERLIHDQIGSVSLLIVAAEKAVNVHGYSYALEYISYRAGGAVRAYERGILHFTFDETRQVLLDDQGRKWDITEEALVGPDGERLERIPGHLAFWFGWYAAFPDTLLFDGTS